MTEKPEGLEETTGGVPAQRRSDLAELLSSRWPFLDAVWPFPEGTAGGMPMRVEEVVENDQLVIRAELPGVDPDKDIDVTLDDGTLTITAERREQQEDRTGRSLRSEFRYGRLVRRIGLPQGTSTEVVSASYRDGILEVRLPAPSVRSGARRIEVERG